MVDYPSTTCNYILELMPYVLVVIFIYHLLRCIINLISSIHSLYNSTKNSYNDRISRHKLTKSEEPDDVSYNYETVTGGTPDDPDKNKRYYKIKEFAKDSFIICSLIIGAVTFVYLTNFSFSKLGIPESKLDVELKETSKQLKAQSNKANEDIMEAEVKNRKCREQILEMAQDRKDYQYKARVITDGRIIKERSEIIKYQSSNKEETERTINDLLRKHHNLLKETNVHISSILANTRELGNQHSDTNSTLGLLKSEEGHINKRIEILKGRRSKLDDDILNLNNLNSANNLEIENKILRGNLDTEEAVSRYQGGYIKKLVGIKDKSAYAAEKLKASSSEISSHNKIITFSAEHLEKTVSSCNSKLVGDMNTFKAEAMDFNVNYQKQSLGDNENPPTPVGFPVIIRTTNTSYPVLADKVLQELLDEQHSSSSASTTTIIPYNKPTIAPIKPLMGAFSKYDSDSKLNS